METLKAFPEYLQSPRGLGGVIELVEALSCLWRRPWFESYLCYCGSGGKEDV